MMNNKLKVLYLFFLITVLGWNIQARAGISSLDVKHLTYQVPLNKSLLINLDKSIGKITKGNPAIADVTVFHKKQIFLRGKKLGTTNTIIWDSAGRLSLVLDIQVTHDIETLKGKLFELFPGEKIEVRSAQKNIVLSGEVSALDKMQAAVDLAESYLGGSASLNKKSEKTAGSGVQVNTGNNQKHKESSKGDTPHVINLLSVSGAHQVMLEVKVAEIDRRFLKGLSMQFSAINASNNFSFGALNGTSALIDSVGIGGLLDSHSIDAAGIFLQAITGNGMFNFTVDAAEDQNLAKIMAEPTLTTISGQEAKFISGGEFPIPVPQSLGGASSNTITVVFKEFGIGVRFLPIVLDSGRINLNMNVSVSELSDNASITVGGGERVFSIPSLTKREASSSLELADGQTMSIAGLISDTIREKVTKFPGLGDIPVLGMLFRSEEFLKRQTELVIFVTPHLAKPLMKEDIRYPTDHFIEPNDIEYYLFGNMEASKERRETMNLQNIVGPITSGGLEGEYGHQMNMEEK